jgi:hypothetical protein
MEHAPERCFGGPRTSAAGRVGPVHRQSPRSARYSWCLGARYARRTRRGCVEVRASAARATPGLTCGVCQRRTTAQAIRTRRRGRTVCGAARSCAYRTHRRPCLARAAGPRSRATLTLGRTASWVRRAAFPVRLLSFACAAAVLWLTLPPQVRANSSSARHLRGRSSRHSWPRAPPHTARAGRAHARLLSSPLMRSSTAPRLLPRTATRLPMMDRTPMQSYSAHSNGSSVVRLANPSGRPSLLTFSARRTAWRRRERRAHPTRSRTRRTRTAPLVRVHKRRNGGCVCVCSREEAQGWCGVRQEDDAHAELRSACRR